MPVIIDQSGKVAVSDAKGSTKPSALLSKNFKPTFFHQSILTGNGKTRGLLNEARNPRYFPNGYHVQVNDHSRKRTTKNGDTTIYDIPFFMISPSGWTRYISTFEPEPMTNFVKIATDTKTGIDVYLDVTTHAAQVEETKTYTPNDKGDMKTVTKRDMSMCFHAFVFFTADINDPVYTQNTDIAAYDRARSSAKPDPSSLVISPSVCKKNTFTQKITHNLFTELRTLASNLEHEGYTVDKTALADYFQEYDLYTNISKAAERIITNVDKYVIDTLAKNISTMTSQRGKDLKAAYAELGSVIEALEAYDVPIQKYNDMYNKMRKIISSNKIKNICYLNLNMMLADTLYELDVNRNKLNSCPNNVPITKSPVKPSVPYSHEQSSAIDATSPLTIVQSGAGTGKSTIILGRIQHMIDNGIDPKTILVLSFTNNAADNILNRNPDVNSMTIDKMMRLIYMENYPSHQLSSLSTIINSLDIYYNPNTRMVSQTELAFIKEFAHVLRRLRDNKAFTNALNFIRDHNAETLDVLDTIQQTSLELQSIICYLNMDTLKEPAEVYTEHLIIDEVQDNSIAQFIYCIGYTEKHHNSLYIVGDCSQTLYEFRGSNPRALNMLEASGIFTPYKLQTNYRSNQAILDFANIYLAKIEANEFANIQLRANDLTPITSADFKNAVKVMYQKMPKRDEDSYMQMTEDSITDIRNWMQEKLDKGEQIAFLAMRHAELDRIEKVLNVQYPSVPAVDIKGDTRTVKYDDNGNVIMEPMRLVSLVPKRQYDNTICSTFVAKFWNTIKYAPPTNIINTIECEMIAHADKITQTRVKTDIATSLITNVMRDFRREHGTKINTLQKNVQGSIITTAHMLNEIRELLISFEISRNSISQAVLSTRNNEMRTTEMREKAHIIISTIHSAKGLEFKNCVIYYNGASDEKMEEDRKRLYYVAFTRAMNCEIIIPYANDAKPKIVNDYHNVIAALDNKPIIAYDDDDEDDE